MQKIPVRRLAGKHDRPIPLEMFKIRQVSSLLNGADLIQPAHRHDFYFILALKKGRGVHEIDFTTYKIADNSVFILRPGQVHRLELKKGSSGYLAEFNTEFYHPTDHASNIRLRNSGNKNVSRPDAKTFEILYSCLEYMFREFTSRKEGYADIIRANINIFLIELCRQIASPGGRKTSVNNYTQERFDEFIDLLEHYIADHKDVAYYNKRMNLSAYQLNGITKTMVGKTSSQLINDHIVLEAKRLLLATTNQVKEIAGELGYEDVSYFTRFFRKQTGYSPEIFRKSFM